MPWDGRQADRLGQWRLFALSLLYWGHRMLAGALGLGWFQTACSLPGEQAADLIFQHAPAPTSGPGEGDLPCLLECLFNWNRNSGCAKSEQI